ncbi:hypothetical protein Cpir12675_000904 [Ceratocystis pirilliformis]|uniref:AB hydrolase-1 domain-containing protein n=1 Tax=Ceratocystis pirilliformis TaxID=259994 RepID=A0ABR3ZI99_9PEZI
MLLLLVGLPLGIYLVFLVVGSFPFLQKHFLYAHKINTLLWDNPDIPEAWGFAYNQVSPFTISTPDGQSIYAWHILPLSLYAPNQSAIVRQGSDAHVSDITKSEGFRLLQQGRNKKVVIYFHGNAGHLANSWRPQAYHALATSSDYHVIAFDYRGFGHSTGSPTEHGLITDARAVIDWVMTVAEVPPENIVLFGHSLGTAVVSAALEHYTQIGIVFAGTLLVAPFTSLPTLLTGYRILGTFPVLGPLYLFPSLQTWIQGFIWERWPTMKRLVEIARACPQGLRITLLHALDDCDIPHTETNAIFDAMMSILSRGTDDELGDEPDEATVQYDNGGSITTWTRQPDTAIQCIKFPYGGKFHFMTSSKTLMAN